MSLTTIGGRRAEMAALLADEALDEPITLPNEGTLPFVLGDALLGTERFRVEDLHLRTVTAGSVRFWVMLGTTPEAQWTALGMEGNHLLRPSDADYDTLHHGIDGALSLLAGQPQFFELVSTFVNTIIPLETTLTDPITSATLPDIPFGVFISPRALVHIPPLSIATGPSNAILAENLVHEATHNMVSKDLLTQELISPDYDSSTSEKIAIPWREDMGSSWELDRMLHAAIVYTRLGMWRDHVLSGAVELNEDERATFAGSREESAGPVQFLIRTVRDYPGFLTDEGRDYFVEATDSSSPMLT